MPIPNHDERPNSLKEIIATKILAKNGAPSSRRRIILFKQRPELEEQILDEGNSAVLNQAMYNILHDIDPSENICTGETCTSQRAYRNFTYGYGDFCSPQCVSEYAAARAKVVSKEKTGYDHHTQNPDVKAKKIATNKKRYGVAHPSQNDDIRTKMSKRSREMCMKKHGVESTGSLRWVQEKGNATMMERYGTTNPYIAGGSPKQSKDELKVVAFIRDELNIPHDEIIQSARLPNNPTYELDIYLPSYNIAIECNGDYWHSAKFKPNDAHSNKQKMCEEQGITLLQFYGSEIGHKWSHVADMIRHKLGKSERIIYARNCRIAHDIPTKDLRLFLDETHMRGFAASKHNVALYDDRTDELVSVLTFKKDTKKKSRAVELTRFASNGAVVGGFSKMLSAFCKKYAGSEYDTITSFLDLRFSTRLPSNLYAANGFVAEYELRPDYMYFYRGRLHHKFGFRKDALSKKMGAVGTTEREMAESIGALPVYDAGKIKYAKRI